MQDPQFAGRPKNVSLRVSVRHSFRAWERCLHPVAEPKRSGGGAVGRMAISSAQRRMRAAKKVVRKS